MKTFKIIGVRPLKGCNKHVIKNLKSDTFYTFYNNYEFKDEKVIKVNSKFRIIYMHPILVCMLLSE